MSKNLITYSIIIFLIIPVFGFNFIINLLGNIFLLILLVPLLLIIITFLTFNSLKKSTNICQDCGAIVIGNNEKCIYCGTSLVNNQINSNESNTASDKIIEIEAEEIK